MKKILLVISIITISITAKAQGNLQFNRVVRESYTGVSAANATAGAAIVAGTITVPANKVWKIESGSVVKTPTLNPFYMSLNIDGQTLYYSNGASGYVVFNSTPIWLNEGTYEVTVSNTYTQGSIAFIAKISAIEFNIVP